jgi:DNA helicase-2/ATP-dependent DNA helicase PcrA
MTRAKDELFLLHARSRFLYGQSLEPAPSPFLREIPEDLVQGRIVPDRPRKQQPRDDQLGLF